MSKKKTIKLTKRSWKRMKTNGWEGIELWKYGEGKIYFFKFGNNNDLEAIRTWKPNGEITFWCHGDIYDGIIEYTTDPHVKNMIPEYVFKLR